MKKNIFHLINKATKDRSLKHSEVRIFLCLISYNSFRKIYPSLETISLDTGIKSKPDISKSLNKLQDLRYIDIRRRKHQTNVYKLNIETTEIKKKVKPDLPETTINNTETQIKFMNNAMIEVCAVNVAIASGRIETERSDYAFVNSMLKLKSTDKFKNDQFNEVRKCLLLLYLINLHTDKFNNGNYFGYIRTVYSNSSYNDIRKKIFENGIVKKFITYKTGKENAHL